MDDRTPTGRAITTFSRYATVIAFDGILARGLKFDASAVRGPVDGPLGIFARFASSSTWRCLMVIVTGVEFVLVGAEAHVLIGLLSILDWSVLYIVLLAMIRLTRFPTVGRSRSWRLFGKVLLIAAVPFIAILVMVGVLPSAFLTGARRAINQMGERQTW